MSFLSSLTGFDLNFSFLSAGITICLFPSCIYLGFFLFFYSKVGYVLRGETFFAWNRKLSPVIYFSPFVCIVVLGNRDRQC